MDTSRTAYKVDASHRGSDVAAETVAAFASASMAFREAAKIYSAKLLSSAKKVSGWKCIMPFSVFEYNVCSCWYTYPEYMCGIFRIPNHYFVVEEYHMLVVNLEYLSELM